MKSRFSQYTSVCSAKELLSRSACLVSLNRVSHRTASSRRSIQERDLAVLREPPPRVAVDLLTTVPRDVRGAVAAVI